MNESYLEIASTEVLEILRNFKAEDMNKIPLKFIEFLKKYENEKYTKNYDFSLPLEKLDLNNNTKLLLGIIYRSFLVDAEEKQKFDKLLIENDIIYKKEAKKYYNMFDNSKDTMNASNNKKNDYMLVSNNNEKWYTRVKKIIRNKLKRK